MKQIPTPKKGEVTYHVEFYLGDMHCASVDIFNIPGLSVGDAVVGALGEVSKRGFKCEPDRAEVKVALGRRVVTHYGTITL